MTWLSVYNRKCKREKVSKRPTLPQWKREKRYTTSSTALVLAQTRTLDIVPASKKRDFFKLHSPYLPMEFEPESSLQQKSQNHLTTLKRYTAPSKQFKQENDSKIKIDNLTLKAIQNEFFEQHKDGVPVHNIVLALVHSELVMFLHSQNKLSSFQNGFSNVQLREQVEAERTRLTQQHRLNLKKALMKLANNSTSVANWRQFESLLQQVLILPVADEDDGETKHEEDHNGMQEFKFSEYRNALEIHTQHLRILPHHEHWKQIPTQRYFDRQIQKQEQRKAQFHLYKDEKVDAFIKEREAKTVAENLLRQLTEEEKERVKKALYGVGPQHETLSQIDNDTVSRQSIQRCRPGTWLNDEIIHFFFAALARRDEKLFPQRRSHFFKSFFITKLLEEGGGYKYSNVKRWSKKVPGKDIFKLDKVFLPINIGNMHWCTACIFIQHKKIAFYDSMGGSGKVYLEALFRYIKDEWKDKKKTEGSDWDQWKLIGPTENTPQQENMSDCGVFTCMFADFLSRDMPLSFTQEHIKACRDRIVLSILDRQAIV